MEITDLREDNSLDGEEECLDDEVDEEKEEQVTFSSSPKKKQLLFALQPYLSSNGGGDESKAFGWFFTDNNGDERTDSDVYTLQALALSGESHKIQAAAAARKWVAHNGPFIFKTIFALQYEEDLNVKTALKFLRIEENGKYLHIFAEETVAGAATDSVLLQLRENVMWGGDTWDGGDFGAFRQDDPLSSRYLSHEDWTTTKILRLSLCYDREANWIPPVYPPKQECVQTKLHSRIESREQAFSFSDFQGILVMLTFLMAVVMMRRRQDDDNNDDEE